MTMIIRFSPFLLLISSWFLYGCGGNQNQDNAHHIKVGVQTGPEYELAEAAKKVGKERFGLEIELVQFNDYVQPNEALQQGDIDANVFQNKPYLDVQAKQRGYKFAIIGNTFVYPMAGYSKKIKTIGELTDGSTIIIPNDPTNGGRALLLLQKAGLLTLKEDVGLLPTVADIQANPKKLRILELEAPQLPRSLDDAHVTVGIINNTFAAPAGLFANRDGLFVEDKESPYVNILVSREADKDKEKIKQFLQAYQSVEVDETAKRVFKGGAVKGW